MNLIQLKERPSRLFPLIGFSSFSENFSAEEQYVEGNEEDTDDRKCDQTLRLTQAGIRRKEHEREPEHHGGNALIDEIFACGRAVCAVDLSQQNDSRACSPCQHAEHGQKLFVSVIGIERLGSIIDITEGGDRPDESKDQKDRPMICQKRKLNGCNARNDHEIKEKTSDSVHHKIVDDLLFDDLFFLQAVKRCFDRYRQKRTDQEVETKQNIFQGRQKCGKPRHQQI